MFIHIYTTHNHYYKKICLPDYQQKTVLTKVFTTQQYANSLTVISDTTTYTYDPLGRLSEMQKTNTDGSITTTYENYTPAGLCGKKTVSAPGCTPRTETYTYDATQRLVTKITNPLGHYSSFTYDAKMGSKTKETDPNELTTKYDYNTFGNLAKVTYPDGTVTKDTVYWFTGTNPFKYETKNTIIHSFITFARKKYLFSVC